MTIQTRARWPLGRRTRRTVLVLHIVASGAWIGLDVVMAVGVFTAFTTDSRRTEAVAYQMLELFVLWPMFACGLTSLLTGLLLGMGTKYGLVRFWWVAVKLVINLLMCTLVLVALRPGVQSVADKGREIAAGGSVEVAVGEMIFPPIVSPALLLVATVLAVFKPWGRIRKRS
jgi:hypothetical protein